VPTWRADYFERANSQTPERSIIIAAENEAVAFEEVHAGMGPTCSRAVVTKLNTQANYYGKPRQRPPHSARLILDAAVFIRGACRGTFTTSAGTTMTQP
jgi:hypothetical protein